jgi:predicted nucleic acid-binding protein
MKYLVDTNVMWRRFNSSDPFYPVVKIALDRLILQGNELCITPQNLIEFRAIATRPIQANGLGMTPDGATSEAQVLESFFRLMLDIPAIYPRWKNLVDTYAITGKQVHDARLVAVMQAYGISNLLTLNPSHFVRFTQINTIDVHQI